MPIYIEEDTLRFVQHPGQGFFSCCTIHLQGILQFFNTQRQLPRIIDSTEQFMFYKTPATWECDIKSDYFDPSPTTLPPPPALSPNECIGAPPVNVTDLNVEEQYSDYCHLNYTALSPFLQRYFSPSPHIRTILTDLVIKYNIQPENTCVLFYRGNDKITETPLPTYQEYIDEARRHLQNHPHMRFWIQSDETEFLDAMAAEFPDNHVVFYDEIRHMPRNPYTTVDKMFRYQNPEMSKNYLAITYLMSMCQYVVCGSGNCSLWIALFRGHCTGLTQFAFAEASAPT